MRELYILGRTPFWSKDPKRMDKNIVKGKINWPDPDKSNIEISEETKEIITHFLQPKPHKRLGYKGLKQVLKHEWFKDIDLDDLINKKIDPPFTPIVKNIDEDEPDIAQAISNYYDMKDKGFKKSAYANQDLLESSIVESRRQMVDRNKLIKKIKY